jgi:adenylate cyclase
LSQSRKYEEAARAFEEAIRLNANLFDAYYYYYARTAFASGDIAHSADLFRRASEVRQEDFQSSLLYAQCLRMLKRDDEWPRVTREGIRRAEQTLALNPVDARALSLGAGALFYDGQIERALAWSRRGIELYPDDPGALVNAACLHSKLGQKEECLELLDRVFTRGWGKRDWIEHDPDYDILRDDPRFKKLLEKLPLLRPKRPPSTRAHPRIASAAGFRRRLIARCRSISMTLSSKSRTCLSTACARR